MYEEPQTQYVLPPLATQVPPLRQEEAHTAVITRERYYIWLTIFGTCNKHSFVKLFPWSAEFI